MLEKNSTTKIFLSPHSYIHPTKQQFPLYVLPFMYPLFCIRFLSPFLKGEVRRTEGFKWVSAFCGWRILGGEPAPYKLRDVL